MVETYIQYGVDSILANKLGAIGIPKTTFERTSKKNLREKYDLTDSEIDIIKHAITRQPIDNDVVMQLLYNSNYTCCIYKGVKSSAYIIHHINEYSLSQDNDYQNLAVLCPDDHDLAHKKGKSLTLKLTGEQIIDAKYKWEEKVVELNIQKASRTGNIFEVDFLNIPRIIELYIEIFKTNPTSVYTNELISKKLIDGNGFINNDGIKEVNGNPTTPFLFFAPYGAAILRFHYYEIFKKILSHIEFKDLDVLLSKESIKNGISGEYCYYVGGLYSSKMPDEITTRSEYMRFHLSKRKRIIQWLVDPKYFCSTSAKARTFERTTYMIYGKIREVEIVEIDGERIVRIDIRPYCFGAPELRKNRAPLIAFRNQLDDILDGE